MMTLISYTHNYVCLNMKHQNCMQVSMHVHLHANETV